jgi:hypothetical protein
MTGSQDIDGLPDSTPLLDDPAALHARWEEDGVLYFPGVVDAEAVAAVRRQYVSHLQEVGVVAEGATDPVWTGLDRLDGALATKIADSVWRDLVGHHSFDSVIRKFLGEAPSWVPIVVHRASPPAPASQPGDPFQGRHQDGPFNYGIEFVTCWVPLMDIDATIGGLAVAPGSHKRSFYDFSDGLPQRPGPIPAGKIPETAWRRPDYKAGDILMFHSMTAHSGLPNRSDRFRLSLDVRFLPGSQPTPMVGVVSGFDGVAVEITTAEGNRRLEVDGETMVRGPKANRVIGEQQSTVLFAGANVIAVPDREGHAKLVRSVSRKYLDLPSAWFTELPRDWVS